MRKSPSRRPELVGKRFGWVTVLSPTVRWVSGARYLRTRCNGCRKVRWQSMDNLRKGKSLGCQPCSQPRRIPKWLDKRLTAAKQRCTNRSDPGYANYGGRGIQFQFPSVLEAGLWIQKRLGLHRDLTLDRIDNNGHYAPGNLRWTTVQAQAVNRRRTARVRWKGRLLLLSHAMHLFRHLHPEVRYADVTLRRLLWTHKNFMGVLRQWRQPSCKPRGVYGTFSTADRAIVSRYLAS